MAAELDRCFKQFSFVLADGTEVFPVRVKCRDDTAPHYRISLGRRGGHVLISGEDVNEATMLHKVVYQGYGVRCASADGKVRGLYRHCPKP
jgi:hypothetical protein